MNNQTHVLKRREAELGIDYNASWHQEFISSAYVCVRHLHPALNEGDVIVVFSQFGEIVDCNLVRDKETGRSRGFAFIAYEDQRSTALAVENFDGVEVKGRRIQVGHVGQYKKPIDEDEEEYERRRRIIWDYAAYEDTVEECTSESTKEHITAPSISRIQQIKAKRKERLRQQSNDR